MKKINPLYKQFEESTGDLDLNKEESNPFKIVSNIINLTAKNQDELKKLAYTVKDINHKYGHLAANNARIESFDVFLSKNKFHSTGILNFYGFQLIGSEEMVVVIPDEKLKLDFTDKNIFYNIDNKSYKKRVIKSELYNFNYEQKVKIGITTKSQPFVVNIKIPLSFYILKLVNCIKGEENLGDIILKSLSEKYKENSPSEAYSKSLKTLSEIKIESQEISFKLIKFLQETKNH